MFLASLGIDCIENLIGRYMVCNQFANNMFEITSFSIVGTLCRDTDGSYYCKAHNANIVLKETDVFLVEYC